MHAIRHTCASRGLAALYGSRPDHVSLVTEQLSDPAGRAATTIATGVESTKTAVLLQVVYQWPINAYGAMLIIIPTDCKRTERTLKDKTLKSLQNIKTMYRSWHFNHEAGRCLFLHQSARQCYGSTGSNPRGQQNNGIAVTTVLHML